VSRRRYCAAAAKRKGNTLKGFEDVCLKMDQVKARIWPLLSDLSQMFSAAIQGSGLRTMLIAKPLRPSSSSSSSLLLSSLELSDTDIYEP